MEMQKIIDFGSQMRPPRKSKWIKNRIEMTATMEEVKFLFFYTPPLQNHYFWVPVRAKMQPQWHPETIFMALEHLDRRAMPFRALL